jgi:hypothetical protein
MIFTSSRRTLMTRQHGVVCMTSVVTPMTCRKDHDCRRRGDHRGRRTDLDPNGSRFTPYRPPSPLSASARASTL